MDLFHSSLKTVDPIEKERNVAYVVSSAIVCMSIESRFYLDGMSNRTFSSLSNHIIPMKELHLYGIGFNN